ncbi:hypothetical protein GQ55_8G244800 [Panicum hallii var. hallii]|uniref:Bifunctional inhibitor/plant lipid transfer protein/seed storage helical domain-containing protein n=1 Tax=Panicum hallii var. hallii TaxID=1504633 RepID=A0A2T7CQS5_9POAL|nr:hypothetical protein GQ55_8G244800 [Panicum hallii var. hallii]
MAPASGAVLRKVAPVAACIMLVLLSMGPLAMADIQDDCRVFCIPRCNAFASNTCSTITGIASILNGLPFFRETCTVRVAQLCLTFCINICTLNTLTPGAPTPARAPAPAGAAPPPCKA